VKKIFLVAVVFVSTCTPAFAWPWNRRVSYTTPRAGYAAPATYSNANTASYGGSVGYGENSTAQGIANIMARIRSVGHFGGNPGYEGCGSGGSPQAAFQNCCYANSGMTTVDVGYAQDGNGMWYCCRRYR
jgi:hypothetical protein